VISLTTTRCSGVIAFHTTTLVPITAIMLTINDSYGYAYYDKGGVLAGVWGGIPEPMYILYPPLNTRITKGLP